MARRKEKESGLPNWLELLQPNCWLKLYVLTVQSKLTFKDVGAILNLTPTQAQNLLQRGRIEGQDAGQQLDNARNLLTTLEYALKRAGNDPALLAHVMLKKTKYRRRGKNPPWYEESILVFIMRGGPEALQTAAAWIKK